MKWMFIAVFALSAFVAQVASASPDCIENYWDMGEGVAVVGFQCGSQGDGIGPEEGRLFFCQRETLLAKGVCTGSNQSIACRWQESTTSWLCHEQPNGNARFDAAIKRISANQIHYQAKSHFNEVDLIGTLIPTAAK